MGHRLDPVAAQVFEVIARERAVFSGERSAAHVAELFGVQLDGQAERVRRLEDAPGLCRGEGDALAERVDGVDQPLCMQSRQPGADRGYVGVGAAVELGRQRVGREACGAHGQGQLATEPARDAQAARFVL